MSVHGISLCKHPHWWCCRTGGLPLREPPLESTVSYNGVLFSSTPRLVFRFLFFHPSMHVEDSSRDTMSDMYMIWVPVCVYVVFSRGAGLRIHGGCWHQNRVNCKHSAAKSSARLQGRAQLADGEPPITFTGGGLEGFSRALSPPGFLATGFPSLGASVCAVRDRNR